MPAPTPEGIAAHAARFHPPSVAGMDAVARNRRARRKAARRHQPLRKTCQGCHDRRGPYRLWHRADGSEFRAHYDARCRLAAARGERRAA